MKTQTVIEDYHAPDGTVIKPFVEIDNGKGIKTKLINFDHPGMCPREGVVEILNINKKNPHNQPSRSFKRFRDPETGIYYGVPIGANPQTGEMEFQRIQLGDYRSYDLTLSSDAKEWAVVRMWSRVEGSPLQKSTLPFYKVVDHVKEAEGKILKLRNAAKAAAIVENLSGLDLIEFSRLLGYTPESNTEFVIQGMVADFAREQPTKFLTIYNDSNRLIKQALRRAVATSVVVFNGLKGYTHKNGTFLGDNEEAAVAYLKRTNTVLMSIDAESKRADKSRLNAGKSDEPFDIGDFHNETNINGENEQLKSLMNEIEELKKIVKKKEVIPAGGVPQFLAKTVDAEEKALREEGRLFKIKGWPFMKLEKLQREIAAKKAEVTT